MKYVKNIFLILAFALSAVAFSTSAMAASETKASPKTDEIPHKPLPEMSKFEAGGMLPPGMYKYCWGN
ncbi:PagK family vesicle-borne virulence factor [Salmonella enterica]|uniref:PagK family vesicle-borne virulence factor n=1 Tax=Salmonella enterica TaxID=28901 RepID=UPI00391821DC